MSTATRMSPETQMSTATADTPGGSAAGSPLDAARRIGVLVRHQVIMRVRDPGQVISYVLTPMILMLVFKPLYLRAFAGNQGTLQVVTGPLIMFSVFTLAIIGNSILVEREWHTWDRLRTSSASVAEILLGKLIPVYLIVVFQQTLLMAYGCLIIGLPFPHSVGLVAIAICSWGLALLALGAALATILRSHAELGMVSDVGAITISALGGALVPVSIMPTWAAVAAHGSPGYWAIRMMQAAVRGDTAGTLRPAALLLAGALAAGTFATYRLARGWGRSHLL